MSDRTCDKLARHLNDALTAIERAASVVGKPGAHPEPKRANESLRDARLLLDSRLKELAYYDPNTKVEFQEGSAAE